jgi:hypothetical protein
MNRVTVLQHDWCIMVSTKWNHHVHAKHTKMFLFKVVSRPCPEPLRQGADQALHCMYVQARFTSFPLFKHAARSARRARAVCLHFEARTQPAQTERQSFRSAISEHWFSQVPRGKKAAELAHGNYSHACRANVPADTVYMKNRPAHGVLVFVTCLHGVA